VDCRLVKQLPGHTTPVSFIISNRGTGSRTIINRKAPAEDLELPEEVLKGLQPELLLFDGHEPKASLQAIKAFPNAITVLDAGSLRDGTRRLAGQVQYLVGSERFAAQVTGQKDVAANWKSCLERLRPFNQNVIVVTLGERGSIYDDGRQAGQIPALKVTARDTTAAGDIFHGAFAFALLRKMELRPALHFATVAAGLSVQQFGGRPSTPNLAAVKEAMAQ